MNIFAKLTLKSLKENKLRTIVTVIGVILSAAMFTAVVTLLISLQNFMVNEAVAEKGNWQGSVSYVNEERAKEISGKEGIKNSFGNRNIGYAKYAPIKNEYKPYIFIIEPDDDFIKNMPVKITEGRLPETDGEILLPKHLITNGEVKVFLGDEISLTVGKRTTEDGFVFWQNQPFIPVSEGGDPEVITETFTKTYKVCGFYERPGFEQRTAPGYTAIVKNQSVKADSVNIYYNMKSPRLAHRFTNSEEFSGEYARTNDSLLMYQGFVNNESFMKVLFLLGGILIGIIVFASVALIYNAFAVSVSSRTRQFGLLFSVGATKKQLRSMVFYEALFVGSAGIPVGILSGLLGIGVTLRFIGDKFGFISNTGLTMEMKVSALAVIASAVIALVTVLISAYIPSRRCEKVTAIDAIRQSKEIKTEKKPVKVSKMFFRLFGFEGMLAKKYMSREKRKYRTVSAALAMSVIMFISAAAFSLNVTSNIEAVMGESDCDVLWQDGVANREEYEKIITFTEKAKKEGVYSDSLTMFIDSYNDVNCFGYLIDRSRGDMLPLNVVFLKDDEFDEYAKSVGASSKDFKDKENPKGILYARVSKEIDPKTGKYKNYPLFAEVPSEFKGIKYSLTSGGDKEMTFVPGFNSDKKPRLYNSEGGAELIMFYPVSSAEALGYNFDDGALLLSAAFESEKPAELKEYLKKELLFAGLSYYDLINVSEQQSLNRDLVTVASVFAYGFITLITLISAANIFNTVSTGIALRRKEFAMLKSVGLTDRGIVKILAFECGIYGTKALLVGVPISALVCAFIGYAINQGWESQFIVPWGAVIGAVLGVFAITFISMFYASRRLKKENILESLRDENI